MEGESEGKRSASRWKPKDHEVEAAGDRLALDLGPWVVRPGHWHR